MLDRLSSGARILIVRLRSLGDCVLTTPALFLLKQARPDVSIGIAVEPRFAAVFADNPDVAHVMGANASAAHRFRPHLCLNLHGGTRSLILTVASRAPFRAGFAHHKGASLYNVSIPTAQEILGVSRKVHTAEHLASAVFYLGVPQTEIPRARLFAPAGRTASPYAVIHPFAAASIKAWPAERFVQVARNLPIEPVFIGAAGDDFTPFRDFRCAPGSTLRETMSLIAGSSMFLGNDSGPAHIAAAYGIPGAVLFGPSDPVIWGPWRSQLYLIHNPMGMNSIGVEQVLAVIAQGVPR